MTPMTPGPQMTRTRSGPPLSRRRKLWFAAVAVGSVAMLTVLAFVAADVYVHQRTQDIAGVNVWGYRGAPRGAKRQGEHRIAMIGGSTVFGWGLPVHESIPAYLEQRLNASPHADRSQPFAVINLGAPGEGAYGFAQGVVVTHKSRSR